MSSEPKVTVATEAEMIALSEAVKKHRNLFAQAIAQSIVLDNGAPLGLKAAWALAPTHAKEQCYRRVDHMITILRELRDCPSPGFCGGCPGCQGVKF